MCQKELNPEGGTEKVISFEYIPEGGEAEVLATFDLEVLMGEMSFESPAEVVDMDVAMDVTASSSSPSGSEDWKKELLEPKFVLQSRDDLEDFVLSTRNVNTVRKTSQVVKVFQEWLAKFCLEKRRIEEIEAEELDQFISNYLLTKKPNKGGQHQPDTLTSIHRAILRHLKNCKYGIDPMNDERFAMSREVLASRRTKLKAEGYGNRPLKAEGLDEEEIEKLWEKGALGAGDPETLQHTIYYYLTIGFGLRGCDESRQMKWGDVELIEGKEDVPYLQWRERSSKTRQGGEGGHVRAFDPKIYGKPGNTRCPVAFYQRYASKRPDHCCQPESPFYLTVKQGTTLNDERCYINCPMGVNKLRNIVKKMCKQAGIVGRHTNHSLRKTACQTLMAANVPPNLVAQLSGHKCLASLNNYSTASKPQQREMSNILTGLASADGLPTSSIQNPPTARVNPQIAMTSSPALVQPAASMSMGPSMGVSPAAGNPQSVLQSLAANTAGMFHGAVVNGPISLTFNYNVHSSSQANVNMSPIVPSQSISD